MVLCQLCQGGYYRSAYHAVLYYIILYYTILCLYTILSVPSEAVRDSPVHASMGFSALEQ